MKRPAQPAAPSVVPLLQAADHAAVRVTRLEPAGVPSMRRMAELGITPGAVVRVMQRTRAALIVSTRSSRVAVDRDLAAAVFVEREAAS